MRCHKAEQRNATAKATRLPLHPRPPYIPLATPLSHYSFAAVAAAVATMSNRFDSNAALRSAKLSSPPAWMHGIGQWRRRRTVRAAGGASRRGHWNGPQPGLHHVRAYNFCQIRIFMRLAAQAETQRRGERGRAQGGRWLEGVCENQRIKKLQHAWKNATKTRNGYDFYTKNRPAVVDQLHGGGRGVVEGFHTGDRTR